MKVLLHPGVSPTLRASLEAELGPLCTLEQVVLWGFARRPMVDIVDVVVQDEFTHDVIAPLAPGLVLVFDST